MLGLATRAPPTRKEAFMNTQPTLTKDGEETGTPGAPHSSDGLKAGLKNRHLSMIAIGGVIGAGLFVGSGSGIAAAGPRSCCPTSSSAPWSSS